MLGNSLCSSIINTPLGEVFAVADESHLYLLEFIERVDFTKQKNKLQKILNTSINSGSNSILKNIESELTSYFDGTLTKFTTPIKLMGTDFQMKVWEALLTISAGKTQSYLELACSIHKPTSCRAVARANSLNRLAIIVPCHRIINTGGALGGYAGGLDRKAWLLNHEKNIKRYPVHASSVHVDLIS